MCGIVGIVTRYGTLAPGVLEAATKSLAHRGPDDSGTMVIHDGDNEIGLGNRRLAILDLSPLGHQPMQDPTTGNWIVHNGEIFNFRELRQELEQAGIAFRTQSDTEVLLKAYGHWGEGCLLRLSGMFAFAIWDARRHRLFLARDPMGIKPLYFGSFGQHFVFASEVRTLLDTGLVPRCLDLAGLQNYLTFGSLYDPTTLIEGVSNLRAGHYLIWEQGHFNEIRYWDLVDDAIPEPEHDSATSEKIEEVLYAEINGAVCKQMVSDVPVGVFLSGGIDSSALVAILARSGVKPETFSIVFRESEYSEAQYSRLIARTFGTNHHEILISQQDALRDVPLALAAMDLPTIDGINTYFVSQQTREAGIKVALSGLGADELFAGYSSFSSVAKMERFLRTWRYVPGKSAFAKCFASATSDTDQNRKLASLIRGTNQFLYPYFLARMLFTPEQRASLSIADDRYDREREESSLRQALSRTAYLDSINRVSYLEARCYMLNTLLRDADVMSMAHGLEIRVPLIDHELAQKLFTIPGAWKISRQLPKPLLVGALQGALPDQVVHRRKQGFALPFEHWLRDELRGEVEKSLRSIGDGLLAKVINSDAAWKVWQDFESGRTSWSRPWSLHVLQQWCERHAVTVGCSTSGVP